MAKNSVILESKYIKSTAEDYAKNPDLVTLELSFVTFSKLKKGLDFLKSIEGATVSICSPKEYSAYCKLFSPELIDELIELNGVKYVPIVFDEAFPELYDNCDIVLNVTGDVALTVEAKYSNDIMTVELGTLDQIEMLFNS